MGAKVSTRNRTATGSLCELTVLSKEKKGDMTRPLNEYFINSSHNTYIESGHQWIGAASVENYAYAIVGVGCRCVEIDVWGDPNPVVRHSPVSMIKPYLSLRDVLRVVRETAFVKSPYPMIISVENHSNENTVGYLILEALGANSIFKHRPEFGPEYFPNLCDLIYTFVVRSTIRDESSVLSKITFLRKGFNTESFAEACKRPPAYRTVNRVYPSRMASSNVDPVVHWAMGVQMVALNVQNRDAAFAYNEALFRLNGQSGYVHFKTKQTNGKSRVRLYLLKGYGLSVTNSIVFVHFKDGPNEIQVRSSKPDSSHDWNETFKFRVQYPHLCFVGFGREPATMYHLESLCGGVRYVELQREGKLLVHARVYK
ncbi:1-phosphatidylinositol 4,5-bisphosphate phosphodiesterase zeta-1-like [Ixodes scapularis]|uniref:1-phosphatidylinositol 4,5-bisphosphate phosphodiesterase zeta-1-like n=1 Tax=Ixodes scapularis TaxID=6945 RepID=UPI001AA00B63|nr:1-phosphatidylinositol 4,5-bisphosphate phosphodiesterase zeta-1-like [Ixodes scapularis]